MAILWERIENMLTETNEPYIRSTINTLKKLQEERTRNICSDPITGNELKTNTRRLFFLKEWEKHVKIRALEAGSTVAGLPYSRAGKTVTQVNITDQGVRLKVNKNISSQAEHNLFLQLAVCKNPEEKDKIYSILLLLHSIGINCLRLQTGKKQSKNTQDFKNSLNTYMQIYNKIRRKSVQIKICIIIQTSYIQVPLSEIMRIQETSSQITSSITGKEYRCWQTITHLLLTSYLHAPHYHYHYHKQICKNVRLIKLCNSIENYCIYHKLLLLWKELIYLVLAQASLNKTYHYFYLKKTKIENRYNLINTRTLILFISDIMYILELYNELMELAHEDAHKTAVNKYLEQNSNALAGHLLTDLQTLTEKQGYWNAKGDIDMETNLKEVRDGFQRLQENYTGISTYITEMDRWWTGNRQTPPCFAHFYHGPDNSTFFTVLVGYQLLGDKKQLQIRMGLLELDIISQYIIIAGEQIRTHEHPGPTLDAFLASTRIPGTKWENINRI